MNERINELFGQALDQAVPETWTTLTHTQLSKLKEKFAELILQEATDIVYDMLDENTGAEVVVAVKEHFGVE